MTATEQNPDRWIRQHLPLVKRIAGHLMLRLPANVELEDLVQVGLLGLLDAARGFDGESPERFESYASKRIRGAMLDELRRMDWCSRQIRQDLRNVERAIARLEQELKRPPLESEIAQALVMPLAEYQALLDAGAGYQLLYLEDLAPGEGGDFLDFACGQEGDDPLRRLNREAFREALKEAIRRLPDREGLVLSLYYEQLLNLKEIGRILEISESRVCQIHTQAITRIRSCLADWSAGEIS